MISFTEFWRHSLFGGFTPEDMQRVLPLFTIKEWQAGEQLIQEGQPNNAIYFLVEGSVSVRRGERELIQFKEGDSFGEIEMLDTCPAAASVFALETARTAGLSHRGLYELSQLEGQLFSLFMMNLARDLARRLRRMDEQLDCST